MEGPLSGSRKVSLCGMLESQERDRRPSRGGSTMSTTTTAADLLEKERGQHYDHLTLSVCVMGELHALFNALALMRGKPGTDDDIRRLIGIGQNIGDEWLTQFEREAEKLKAQLPGGHCK